MDGHFGTFPRDLGYHGMRFNKTFREGTWLIPQDNTHSPIDVVDAAIRDINGDNVPDPNRWIDVCKNDQKVDFNFSILGSKSTRSVCMVSHKILSSI
jgi:hypothetical protein